MPNTTRTFSLQFCSVTLGTLPAVSGFAEGDAMTVEFPNDDFEVQNSSDGESIFVQKHNQVADGMIRLGQGNPLIDLIRALHEASLVAGGLSYDFSAINLKSPTELVKGKMVFKKRIPVKWADTAQPAEIPFYINVSAIAGGNILPT
jgi:hypothetical protein